MKRLSITQLIPGMIVAEDVYNLDHELLIPKGTVLTDKLITKLDLYGILTIFAEDVLPASDLSETESSHYERIKSSPEFHLFKEDFENEVELFRENMNLVVQKNTALDVKTLLKNTLSIVSNHSGSISILDMLQNMREYDDSTYTHSLNVALICNVIGNWLRMNEKDLKVLVTCGLLHDIGKLRVPNDIITKPGKLTGQEYEIVKKHPQYGYEMLKDKNLDRRVKLAALQHHERFGGTGYPYGLMGSGIEYFSSIVAVADVYDAMTSNRCYRKGICPFKVIGIFVYGKNDRSLC